MAIFNKNDLKTLRSNIIKSNGAGEITGTNLGGFTDDFIDSIWFYVDTSTGTTDLGELNVWDDTYFGLIDENYINFDANGMKILLNSDDLDIMFESPLLLNVIKTNAKKVELNNIGLKFLTDMGTSTIQSDSQIKLKSGTDFITQLEIGGDDVVFTSDWDNGIFHLVDRNDSVSYFTASKTGVNIKGNYSVDSNIGITETIDISSPLLNRTITIKGGIVTNVSSDGWDVQLNILNSVTNNPVEGLNVDIYLEQELPVSGKPLVSYVTSSIGRVVFKSNPNTTYRLYIYGGNYTDIYPELVVNSNPKIVSYFIAQR